MTSPAKKLTFLSFSFCLLQGIFAQNTNISPYSRFGIGDLNQSGFAQNFGMGGFGIGFAENTSLNLQNPATTSFLAKPVFDMAVKSTFARLENNTSSQKMRTTYINHFAYAFPVKNRWTITAALIPVSRVGYNIRDSYALNDSTNISLTYKGNGGLSKALLGNSYKIFNRKDSTVLSVGLNINYIFGTLEKQRRAYYPQGENFYNTRSVSSTTLKDFSFDLGAYFSFYPNPQKSLKIGVGATYGIASSLRASQESLTETFVVGITGLEFPVDTVHHVHDDKGSVRLPQSLGLGVSALLNNKLMIGIDYSTQNWSSFSQTINNTEIKDNLSNSSRLSAGIQYTPQQTLVHNTSIVKFFSYRLGFRTENTYLQLNNSQVKSNAFSAGLGIPLRKSNSLSKINIGYEYATRGTTANQLIREKYSNFIIGISLSPSNADRWFYKRKYD